MKITPIQMAVIALIAIILACAVGLATGSIELRVESPPTSSSSAPVGNTVMRWMIEGVGVAILIFWAVTWFRKRRSDKPPGPWS